MRLSLCEWAQLGGQCERHHKIIDRQQLVALACQPFGGGVVLAKRAAAMAAGTRRDARIAAAFWAAPKHVSERTGTAAKHRVHRTQLVRF